MQKSLLTELFAKSASHAARFRGNPDTSSQAIGSNYADMVKVFDEPLPPHPGQPLAIVDEYSNKAERGLHMPTGPRFFGWVIGGSHPVGVAVDMLVSAYGQNTGNHHAAPSASAAETVAAKWLLEILDLPPESSIGFVTGATVANFTCLAAARGEVLHQVGWDANSQGLFGAPPITVLIGDDAHTSVFGALQFLGLGHDRVVRVPTDAQGVMQPDRFVEIMAMVNGPAIVILQAGQINTGASDKFSKLIPLAKAKGAWVHVDGAFGLWARASKNQKPMVAGVELADSWATDGHKWLQTPYDCGYAIVRNELAHRRAMTIAASYLPAAVGDERDPSHYVPELSRRARGALTWAMFKALGRSGIAEMVERHCAVARQMADALKQEPGVTVMNDVVLNQAIIRFGADRSDEAGDQLTQKTIARIQKDGVLFAGGAKWRGRQVMRLSVIGFKTDAKQGKISTDAIIAAYRNSRPQE